ncbi:hypothetical protein [Bacillus andreraoultii]|uniref:hypothetical protein n=1 Tax=Bacillus andreraoultii TaxID=1499685 RepID=UPI00053A24B8|nr:hypothetical protein [Bacillus andreraoultii]
MNGEAVKRIEAFIESGNYPRLKQIEKDMKLLTTEMRGFLESSEIKRHEFPKYQLVARFTAKKIYKTDTQGLNEYLFDIGLLPYVVGIDQTRLAQNQDLYEQLQDFRLPDRFYVKANFNKEYKRFQAEFFPSYIQSEHMELEDIVRNLAHLKKEKKVLTQQYNQLKKDLMKLPEIQHVMKLPSEERKSLHHKYGSLSIQSYPKKYDSFQIFNQLKENILIKYGKPKLQQLEQFSRNGLISERDLNQYRVLTDIRLDFSVITMDDEKKILSVI